MESVDLFKISGFFMQSGRNEDPRNVCGERKMLSMKDKFV